MDARTISIDLGAKEIASLIGCLCVQRKYAKDCRWVQRKDPGGSLYKLHDKDWRELNRRVQFLRRKLNAVSQS